MPETVLFESESDTSRADVAAYLRQVADRLESGEAIALSAGDQSHSVDPPDVVEFEVKAEREGPTDGDGELSVEFEIEWPENPTHQASAGGDLQIE